LYATACNQYCPSVNRLVTQTMAPQPAVNTNPVVSASRRRPSRNNMSMAAPAPPTTDCLAKNASHAGSNNHARWEGVPWRWAAAQQNARHEHSVAKPSTRPTHIQGNMKPQVSGNRAAAVAAATLRVSRHTMTPAAPSIPSTESRVTSRMGP